MEFRPCIIVPCYNHGETVHALLEALMPHSLPVILVDDGSDASTKRLLADAVQRHPQVELVTLDANQGKGYAVLIGMRRADEQGFTHALQIDADGQHDSSDIPKLLALARKHPGDVISGRPIFDESIPPIRFYGRYVTHVLVWLHTLSFSVRDSMCGFRVYPIRAFNDLVDDHPKIGRRMDFDVDVMVRLYWRGCHVHFVDTKVIYPEGGISHYRYVYENVRMVSMHVRLFCGMVLRMPRLLRRKAVAASDADGTHWSKKGEHGTILGIKFMLSVYALLGRRVFGWFLRPVILYYYIAAKEPRKASLEYLERLKKFAAARHIPVDDKLTTYRHILSFGYTILDNMAAWRGDIRETDIVRHGWHHYDEIISRKEGSVVIGAHLGSMEVCRAMSHVLQNRIVNALVFTRHASRFNAVTKALNPKASLNIIQVDDLGPDTAIVLKQKLEAGEWVVFVGDRTSVTSEQRVVWADFLGEPAPFPQGPFLLASILQVPVYLILGVREDDGHKLKYHLHFEKFSDRLDLPRAGREKALKEVVARYAERLESYVVKSPLQWYNFFDFWRLAKKKHE